MFQLSQFIFLLLNIQHLYKIAGCKLEPACTIFKLVHDWLLMMWHVNVLFSSIYFAFVLYYLDIEKLTKL